MNPGPLELTRRTKALVWDDETEIIQEMACPAGEEPQGSSPRPSINTVPLPRRTRSLSHASEFPPPLHRRSSEVHRPVSFSSKFQKIPPGTTGVTMLEHLERLDAVEASLQRLGVDEPLIEEEEEVDVGESSASRGRASLLIQTEEPATAPQDMSASVQFSPPESPDDVTSLPGGQSLAASMTEEDLTVMSRSMSHVESPSARHLRWNSHATHSRRQLDSALEWMNADETEQLKRTVVVEVSFEPLLYRIDI